MIILLIIVIGLVTWSLRLMQEAFKLREFSLMLAGTLVAISAAGVVVVYMLMDGCMGYLVHSGQPALPVEVSMEPLEEASMQSIVNDLYFSVTAPIMPTIANQDNL